MGNLVLTNHLKCGITAQKSSRKQNCSFLGTSSGKFAWRGKDLYYVGGFTSNSLAELRGTRYLSLHLVVL